MKTAISCIPGDISDSRDSMNELFFTTPTFHWVVLPFLIFCARICDVTIGTVRILLLARGRKFLVPVLGFIEVMIWLLAVE